MPDNQPQSPQLNIRAEDKTLRGQYANAMRIFHTREEFVLDFLNLFPPQGTLNARIIMNPGHLKRMISALRENLEKYESNFGTIQAASAPEDKVGFDVKS